MEGDEDQGKDNLALIACNDAIKVAALKDEDDDDEDDEDGSNDEEEEEEEE